MWRKCPHSYPRHTSSGSLVLLENLDEKTNKTSPPAWGISPKGSRIVSQVRFPMGHGLKCIEQKHIEETKMHCISSINPSWHFHQFPFTNRWSAVAHLYKESIRPRTYPRPSTTRFFRKSFHICIFGVPLDLWYVPGVWNGFFSQIILFWPNQLFPAKDLKQWKLRRTQRTKDGAQLHWNSLFSWSADRNLKSNWMEHTCIWG